MFIVLCHSLVSFAQKISNDAESGANGLLEAQCWQLMTVEVSNHNATLLSGKFSLRSMELQKASLSDSYVKTPWIKFNEGKITLKAKLDGSEGGNRSIIVRYIPFDEGNSATGEGTPAVLYTFDFPHPVNKSTTVYDLSIPVPKVLVNGKPYKVSFDFVGTGGTARIGVDDIVLPGTYHSDPSSGCFPIKAIQDADGDGVMDSEDEFPNDPYRAYNNYLPANGYGTLMFEDLWPGIGDYDFNDLVVDYRINRITDAKNEIVEAIIELRTRAIGAGFKNGLGIEFTNIPPGTVTSVSGTHISPESIHRFLENGLEAGTRWLTLIPYDNAFRVLSHPGGGTTGVNTDISGRKQEVIVQTIVVTFKKEGKASSNVPVRLKDLGMANFNPFLIRNQERKIEIHLPGKPPTALADQALFGTLDDNSIVSSGRYYQSKGTNLPWALHVNQSIPYMQEKNNFTSGYLKFQEWAISNGSVYQDWYLDLPGYRDKIKIY